MPDVKISALPAATTPLAGTELVPIVQSGVTSRVSVDNLTAGKTVAASTVNVDANTASAAVRITQTGAGNSLVVEDSTSPDATPFVVDANGTVVVGHTSALVGSYDVQSITTDGASYVAQRYNAASGGPFMRMDKSRGATIGTNTVVQNNDTIGTVEFRGNDGSAFINAAQIRVDIDNTPGSNDMPGRLVFLTTADGAAATTERMRIDSNGNVRVGTAALATTATNGFLYVPTCAGAPTGVPTAITGLAPIVIDSTNNKLYFYSGGAWRDAGP